MKISRKIKRFRAKSFLLFNQRLRQQRKNFYNIPILIVNYNQLKYMRVLIDSLMNLGYTNIIIIDNKSTYPPLLDYYKTIAPKIKIEYMGENHGHDVFFKNKELQDKYGKGYYAVTDPDIILNENLPKDFLLHLIKVLDRNFKKITKAGFALDISDIPDYFPLKDKVVKWESQFWEKEISENVYRAYIDTTFALYKPEFIQNMITTSFYEGIRVAGNYTAKHMGWYLDINNLTDEQVYYQKSSNKSASWKLSDDGGLFNENANYK